MLSAPANLPDWNAIDTVLLDLDGTLLDLAFDNYVWMGRIPELYAEARGLSVPEAQAALAPKFRALQGSLEWYCIDHWSRELQIDIAQLHRDEAQRIGWLPGARGFLERMRERGKRLVLLTNSHPVTLDIKHGRTRVLDHFDAAFSSQQFGAPKEDQRFWQAVQRVEPFDPARSIFVDDSAAVLHAAKLAGVRWVYAVRKPDSSRRPHAHEEFTAIDAVAELG
jgi:HAD superfamily hydrolase (TIGR01509 family)